MIAAGIVAEYNPFHMGHLYHIRKTRESARIDAIVAVISSNFVQRGEPAIVDKRVRTLMALSCGADLALELPVAFSSHNAGPFGNAAVDILAATGRVSSISFGMEDPDRADAELPGMADILNDEPEEFKLSLRKKLSLGYSFVQARSMALDEMKPGALEILKRPNNNLALSYVKRIREMRYPIKTIAIQRFGAGHNEGIAEGAGAASASAIRGLAASGDVEAACSLMPDQSAELFREACASGHAARDGSRFWTALRQAIIRAKARDLAKMAGMSEGLENRVADMASRAESYESFVDSCTSRRYPRGRILRLCVHILLNLSQEESMDFQSRGPAYIRVLGANRVGRNLLAEMRQT
ncbi:MAG: nucleotidyltransferase family protein, partial [Synergistaceae bacterium]|nr:nucleotidyltransferase family protein [Synergistaceae bacterium]